MTFYGIGDLGNSMGAVANALVSGHSVDLSPLDDDALLGLMEGIGALNAPAGAKKAAKKKVASAMKNKGSRNVARETTDLSEKALFEQRIGLLPADAQQKLKSGQWQVVPFTYYGCKFISQQNHVDIFKSGDITEIGLTNLVQGRMPAEDYFLATKVRVRAITGLASQDNALLKTAAWAAPTANITNGEWYCGQESTTYIDKSAASVFEHSNRTDLETGLYVLPTPKMFYPQREVKVEFDFAGTPDAGANTFSGIRVDIIGVKTTKA